MDMNGTNQFDFQSQWFVAPWFLCAVIAERNPLTNEYIDNIRKFIPLLRSKEFAMHDAAAYLEAWITGTLQMKPLMAVDARLDCKIHT